ncbi:hypothetical protein PybrP1_001702 [[Pythium] brassicae (nom. inval.)]|nr:hypothetical protein PybrP1_001702 [[Pythium] brassicae (nom. inval.)]
MPSLGDYSAFTAIIVHNTTEETGEVQGCLGVLIAPMFLVADGQCMSLLHDPQVVVTSGQSSSSTSAAPAQRTHKLYTVSSVALPSENMESIAIVKLTHAVSEMTPVAISRRLPAEYSVTDASWEIVAMDNLFAPERADQSIITKKSVVWLPMATCSAPYLEGLPPSLCLALGTERDREQVFAFSQGFVLHDKQLVALPQCYGAICLSGLFQDATFVAAREDWIRHQTEDTALWGREPLDGAVASGHEQATVSAGPTYAVLVDDTKHGAALCSGVLIAPRFVLTTATCVANATVTHVHLGVDQAAFAPSLEDILAVRAVHVHPEFSSAATRAASNLALVELVAMSYFLPVQLAAVDKIPAHPVVFGNASNSSVDSDVEEYVPGYDYSWELSTPLANSSVICSREHLSSNRLASAGGVSATRDTPAHSAVVSCFSVQSRAIGAASQGAGLVAAFSSGNALLGVLLPRCTSAACSRPTNNTDVQTPHSCYIRIAAPNTRQFIDSVSEEHRWRAGASISMFANGRVQFEDAGVTSDQSDVLPADATGYTGTLDFDSLPANAQVGFVVGLRKSKSSQNFCGGSLIAPGYVLTAAHCVVGGEAQYVSVGSHESAGTKAELIPIKKNKVIVHPSYGKRSSISYDVAIVELESQAYPAPIQLDNALSFNASTHFTLLGYGANSAASSSLSPILRSVQLPFYDRELCRKYFPELDSSMLCAGGEPARDACKGDSGSPLVYYSGGATPVLVGVVSTGRNGCGTPGVPGIYGFVAEMQAFIVSYAAGYAWLDPSKAARLQVRESSATSTPTSGTTTSVAALRSSLDEYVGSDTPFEIIHKAASEDVHQLSVVKLADDTPDALRDAVKAFLLGEYSMIGGSWGKKTKEIQNADTSLTFYSSGDMTGLMGTITQHRAKPLYQRSARFGKRVDKSEERHKCCDGVV